MVHISPQREDAREEGGEKRTERASGQCLQGQSTVNQTHLQKGCSSLHSTGAVGGS